MGKIQNLFSKKEKLPQFIIVLLVLLLMINGVFFYQRSYKDDLVGSSANEQIDTLPAVNTLRRVAVNSAIIGNITSGKIYNFKDSFSIRIENAQTVKEGVELNFRIFNRDSFHYSDPVFKFQVQVRKDGGKQVETKVASGFDIIPAGGSISGKIILNKPAEVGDIGSIKVFAGE
jgi:hypothetical protein